jgi:integrase
VISTHTKRSRDTVRQSTLVRYEQLVRLHISPALGRIALKSLSAAHVQGFYRDRLDSGFSPATVQKIHTVLHKALDQAASWSLVPCNPTESVKAPRAAPEEIRPLNREQAKALLETARGERSEALYVLAVTAGLRQGELLGLKGEDVDLENSLIRVRRTLIRNRGAYSSVSQRRKGAAGRCGSQKQQCRHSRSTSLGR